MAQIFLSKIILVTINFLDAIASLDFKLSVSQSVIDLLASASTGLLDYFVFNLKAS